MVGETAQRRPGQRRYLAVLRTEHLCCQTRGAIDARGGDNAELSEVATERIHQRRALPYQQLTRAVHH